MNDIFDNCEDYPHEQALIDLIEIEQKIANKLNLVESYGYSIRRQLCVLDRAGELYEDSLVMDWHQQLALVYS